MFEVRKCDPFHVKKMSVSCQTEYPKKIADPSKPSSLFIKTNLRW